MEKTRKYPLRNSYAARKIGQFCAGSRLKRQKSIWVGKPPLGKLPFLYPSGGMVDTAVSKSVVARRVGSSPTLGTKEILSTGSVAGCQTGCS